MSAVRPKVLMVGPWPPTRGGVTTFMCNVVSSPLREQYDFIPFTTSRPGKRNVKGDNYGYFAVFRGGFKRVVQGILFTLWHLAIYPCVVVARRPAIIQVQASDFQAFWEASLYVLMGKIFRRPIVLRIGGSFNRFWEFSGAGARAAIQWTLRQPSLLVVQSEYWKSYVTGVGRTGPILILNNFVPETLVEKRTLPADFQQRRLPQHAARGHGAWLCRHRHPCRRGSGNCGRGRSLRFYHPFGRRCDAGRTDDSPCHRAGLARPHGCRRPGAGRRAFHRAKRGSSAGPSLPIDHAPRGHSGDLKWVWAAADPENLVND